MCRGRSWTKLGRSMDKRLYYRLCVSCRIDTWQIVYLLYEDACPIYQFIKMRFMYINVPWTSMDLAAQPQRLRDKA